ncbi:extracellular solute-binding protein [Streptomyces sp. ODS28]|uniref:extracellular solute-binding protein n=1 Tax=Streptomyces sp. ODS28 TaxID=3136688 RepID=UPI0031EC5550
MHRRSARRSTRRTVPTRRTATPLALALAGALAAAALSGCGGGSGGDKDTVKIAFNKDTNADVTVRDDFVKKVAEEFEKTHKGKKVELVPIQASPQDYYTKLQQMMRSPRTTPDVVYEDTFLINSDIKSGYLRPLDGYLSKWREWGQFEPTAKAAARAADGKTYGVPDGTDTRGLWFNKKIFKKAGLPQDWQPKDWNEVLDAARTIKKKVPGVTPLNVFTGKSAGEAAAMQGFEMLLYGTGEDPLYDPGAKKWVTGSKGFRDSLDFVRKVYGEKLGPDVSQALSPTIQTRVVTEMLPKEKLAIDLDGSWLGQQWIKSGGSPWPGWEKTMGLAKMPTQHGQAPGEVSMSGGWTWAISAKSQKPDLAWQLIKSLQTRKNAVEFCVSNAQIAVRKDVAADPRYKSSMPGVNFFTARVKHSNYRPALPVYPQVSTAITEAMEGVTTGDASVSGAAKTYDEQLGSITSGAVVEK